VITIDNITKSFMTLRGRKYVFRNMSLDIPEGRNIGLIGRNGAGKTTLMRLLSAVDLPDTGHIRTRARLSWPVGLPAACSPPHGPREREVCLPRARDTACGDARESRFVEAFAELGSYFDQPVSTYSSGMRARLAFGTSMAFDFDYYLIDEVMSVGDASFKAKSREVFNSRMKNSNIILVSHNMNTIRKMCDLDHSSGGR
jgi:capsular polysaccharide transport system ATP-binding protein